MEHCRSDVVEEQRQQRHENSHEQEYQIRLPQLYTLLDSNFNISFCCSLQNLGAEAGVTEHVWLFGVIRASSPLDVAVAQDAHVCGNTG